MAVPILRSRIVLDDLTVETRQQLLPLLPRFLALDSLQFAQQLAHVLPRYGI